MSERPRDRRPVQRDPTPARVLGIAGVIGLMIVLFVSIGMIAGSGDDDDDETAITAAPTATVTATRTPKPKKTPEPLTPTERAERDEAVALVESRAFEVVRPRDWNPEADLRVLIGETSTGGRMAFFFVAGDYLGNDAPETSADLKLKSSEGLEATLVYGTPGGPIQVDFRYDGASVEPVQILPTATDRAAGSPD